MGQGNGDDARFEGPASRLVGKTLDDGWSVIKRLESSASGFRGMYSVGYQVKNVDGRLAYMKAHDYARAISENFSNFSHVLEDMLSAHNFELELNKHCVKERMTRVVRVLGAGAIHVEGSDIPVNYLIFELADGDIRDRLSNPAANDLVWKLRTAHQIAVGLSQLHRAGVHHQNIKPSTLMDFGEEGSKIGGLANASRGGRTSPLASSEEFPGDPEYAPPECLYEYELADAGARLKSRDLYMFGSVVLFLFGGVDATCALLTELPLRHHPGASSASFEQALPYLIEATDKVAEDLAASLESAGLDLIASSYSELCNPDPLRRGHPNAKGRFTDPYSLERYVSLFDHLLKQYAPPV